MDNELMTIEPEERALEVSLGATAAIAKSEVEAQLDAAHKYRRSPTRFLQEAVSLATITEDVAASCMYCLPREGKQIVGPSVRLAEIVASSYGNLHIAARVTEMDETSLTAQGGAWDLEKNLRVTIEVRRRITGKSGKRYGEDMINVTGMAAISIARRNAIFAVVPRAYIDRIFDQVRRVAVGDAKTLSTKRADLLGRLAKLGADQARVLQALGKSGVDDIDLTDMEKLIGWGTSIKDGMSTVDELFPAVARDLPAAPEGKRMSLNMAPKRQLRVTDAEGNPINVPEREPGAEG
jgi:hypothetical protein